MPELRFCYRIGSETLSAELVFGYAFPRKEKKRKKKKATTNKQPPKNPKQI